MVFLFSKTILKNTFQKQEPNKPFNIIACVVCDFW